MDSSASFVLRDVDVAETTLVEQVGDSATNEHRTDQLLGGCATEWEPTQPGEILVKAHATDASRRRGAKSIDSSVSFSDKLLDRSVSFVLLLLLVPLLLLLLLPLLLLVH